MPNMPKVNKLTRKRWYAEAKWHPDDVKSLKPRWTDEQCRDFLARYGDVIRDSMIERGWEVLGDCIIEEEEGELRKQEEKDEP